MTLATDLARKNASILAGSFQLGRTLVDHALRRQPALAALPDRAHGLKVSTVPVATDFDVFQAAVLEP